MTDKAKDVRNVLFIMADQLRFDYLSCAGHPHLHTPNIDALAARGVRFDEAYVQSPVCGSSRMSFYTGRYCRSTGAVWNNIPLRVDELTLGDYLKELDMRTVLVGKTHMAPNTEAMERLGIEASSGIGVHVSQCGFEPYERDDGLHPTERPAYKNLAYNKYLEKQGYEGDNLWHEWANSAMGEDDEILSGWLLAHADKPARIADEDSETPYMTRRAMEFIAEADAKGERWCCHLSYIKPHWPYIVPAPYHNMYGKDDLLPVVRHEVERQSPHPVYGAFMEQRASTAFAKDHVREHVLPAYMGLIKQLDDQIGELMKFLEEQGRLDDTMIVFTSDHGDYMGDHWMGEKDMFHQPSVKVPMIVFDPRASADATRGTVENRMIEAIDLVPTFIEACGGTVRTHVVEGRSLEPLLAGEKDVDWREAVFSEYDYGHQWMRQKLGRHSGETGMTMIFDGRYKFVHCEGYCPILHDLQEDPQEFFDRGDDPEYASVIQRMEGLLLEWALTRNNRVTKSDAAIDAYEDKKQQLGAGVAIGFWDEKELEEARREAGFIKE